jgi:uncharacterized membrane protein
MVGFELKGLVVILLIISIVVNFITYEEKWTEKKELLFGFIEISGGTSPKNRFWYLLVISLFLFIYGLYLNDIPPVILF